MARTRGFDEQAAVRAAREVFWQYGYATTSLPQLQAATGLSRSSMYAAFGSKRGLFERAAMDYLADVIDPLLAPMEAPDAGAGDLVAFFRSMGAVLRNPDERLARRGCFILNTALELDELDREATEMVGRYRSRVHAAIRNALDGLVSPDALTDRAEVLTADHVGVMITARIAPLAAAIATETVASDLEQAHSHAG